MAIAYKEIDAARSSTQTRDWKRTYTRAFNATTDDPRIGAGTVRAALVDASGRPITMGLAYRLYDSGGGLWEQDLGCFVNTIAASSDGAAGDGLGWIVTVEYSQYDPTTFPKNPIDWPLKISWDQAKFESVATKDLNGNAITNTAFEYFDPPVAVDDSRWVLTIVRNEPKFDPAWADQYKDATNLDDFFGRPPKTWKVASITSGDPIKDADCQTNDGFYYAVKYQFEYRKETWELKILDQGLRRIDATTGKLVQIKDDEGQTVTSPWLLDGSGGRLPKNGTPYFVVHDYYQEVAFATLNLDPAGAPAQGN